ncbi:MAG: hypothetical protein ABEN55_16760 [Bradymonadaceae bacterium]
MVETSPSDPDVGILIDTEQPGRDPRGLWDAGRFPVATIEELEGQRAPRAVESQARLIVLDGDDRLVSRALTVYQRHHRGREKPLEFLPLETGRFRRIAEEIGAPEPSARLADRLAGSSVRSEAETHPRRTLKVTSSSRPAPIWGLSVGVGLLFRLFEMLLRSEGAGLRGIRSAVTELARELTNQAGRRFEPVRARVTVDYQPWSDQLGYLMASGLRKSWLGVRLAEGDRPRWQGSESARGFIKKMAGAAAIPGFLRGAQAEGFVVDGELYDTGGAHVLQIAPGPQIDFVTL